MPEPIRMADSTTVTSDFDISIKRLISSIVPGWVMLFNRSNLSLSLNTISANFVLSILPLSFTSGKVLKTLWYTLCPGVIMSFATKSDLIMLALYFSSR